jgi:hypothetical protein
MEKADPEREAAMRLRRQLRTLMETPTAQLSDAGKLLGQLVPSLAKLPDDQAARTALAVARQYERRGQWELAREAYLLLIDRYAAHPVAAEAYGWLIRHNSSSEARRRHELGQFLAVTHGQYAEPAKGGIKQAGWKAGPSGAFELPAQPDQTSAPLVPELTPQKRITFLKNPAEMRHWYRGSLQFAEKLAGFGPAYDSDPALQFCLQAARRHLGEFAQVQEWYAAYAGRSADSPWRDVAAAELWLSSPNGPPPRPVAACRSTDRRPYLDAKFDDACWQGVQPLTLRTAIGKLGKQYTSEARLAYDQDFLYLGLSCTHPAQDHVPPVKVRSRDADLRSYDRVSILLDLDRDYSTYFRLEVDQRGCVREDCWGDRSWNPQWFVAVRSDKEGWHIEAAIPLAQLTGDKITAGTAWACNVVRTLPGRGVQAWSLPADVEPRPEGMGLLIFQSDRPENGKRPRAMPKVP